MNGLKGMYRSPVLITGDKKLVQITLVTVFDFTDENGEVVKSAPNSEKYTTFAVNAVYLDELISFLERARESFEKHAAEAASEP